MSDKLPVEKLVAAYRKLRAAIAEEEEAFEARVANLKEKLDYVSNELLTICNEQNADSIRTPAGTVSRRVQSRYWSTDWEQMYKFIEEHNVPFVLEKRIHNGNMKQFLEENPDVLPVGLQVDNKYVVHVRKPTEK
jgi:hypothetical protein